MMKKSFVKILRNFFSLNKVKPSAVNQKYKKENNINKAQKEIT